MSRELFSGMITTCGIIGEFPLVTLTCACTTKVQIYAFTVDYDYTEILQFCHNAPSVPFTSSFWSFFPHWNFENISLAVASSFSIISTFAWLRGVILHLNSSGPVNSPYRMISMQKFKNVDKAYSKIIKGIDRNREACRSINGLIKVKCPYQVHGVNNLRRLLNFMGSTENLKRLASELLARCMPGHILYHACASVSVEKMRMHKSTYSSATKYERMSEITIVHSSFGAVFSADVPVRIEYFRIIKYLWVMIDSPCQSTRVSRALEKLRRLTCIHEYGSTLGDDISSILIILVEFEVWILIFGLRTSCCAMVACGIASGETGLNRCV